MLYIKSFPFIFYEGPFIATLFSFISKLFWLLALKYGIIQFYRDGQVEPIKSICLDKRLICDHFHYEAGHQQNTI